MSLTPAEADRGSRDASIVLALTLPTDTVLYLLLPLHAAAFDVTLAEAGILLAANRMVRILGYGWVARLHHERGARICCVGAAAAAAASSFGYALFPGLWALLVARLLWGLAFAAMNIATQALATAAPEGASRRNGRSRAIIAAGPTVGLLGGALLSEVIGAPAVFHVLGAVALFALPFALRLPEEKSAAIRPGGPRFSWPARLDVWSFVQGLTLDGLFVIGLSVLAAATMPQGAALAAGAALALRYLAEILLGPAGGALGERHGPKGPLILLSLASAAGLAVIGLGALWMGAVGVMVLRGLMQPLPSVVAAQASPGPGRVAALARMATWRDIGAATGPLLAGVLLPIVATAPLYAGAALLLAGATLALRR